MREHVSKLIGEAEEIRPHANGDARPGGGAADKKAANWEAERKELATKVADLALTRLTDEAKYLFELRAQMARTGLTKRELAGLVKPVYEKLKAKQDQELGGEAPPAQRDEVEAIGRSCELFRDADGAGYASVQREGHCETWSISSDRFRRYLLGEYRRRHGRLAAGTALSDGIEGIAALAAEGPIREVFVRVADAGGRIYLDLGRDDWKIVEIDGQGWRILDTSPVPFLRPAGMRPLPLPCRDALGIARLRPLVNIPSDKDWILYVSFLIGCFLPKGPYPILIVNGEQGSAKTWTIKVTRRLLDPAKIDAAKPPRSEEDLLIVALHYRLLCYDNFSSIGDWLADAFCRLSSGAGEQKRTLHTNTDLTEINAWRPLALNGIPDLTSRGDFADRTIVLVQPRIPDERRRQEEELDQELISSAPTILGGLLDGVAAALANRRAVAASIVSLPRLADFTVFAAAAASAFGWTKDAFLEAYEENRLTRAARVVEANPVAETLCRMVAEEAIALPWEGTATDLLAMLDTAVSEGMKRQRIWPKGPGALSSRLLRTTSDLRQLGIEVTKNKSGDRKIFVRKTSSSSSTSSNL